MTVSGDAGQTPLILVGASVRAAAQSARRAGVPVIGIDLFADRDTRQACDRCYRIDSVDELAPLLARVPPARLMQVGGLSGELPILQEAATRHRLLGTDPALAATLADPEVLAEIAEQAGLGFPQTVKMRPLAANGQQDGGGASIVDRGPESSGRWLLKAASRCGGLGVRWAVASREARDASAGISEAGRCHWQRWVPGRVYGASYLATADELVLLGWCRGSFTRRCGLPFLYAGSLGPLRVDPQQLEQTLAGLGQSVRRLGARGLFGADVLIDPEGRAWLLEINPRWTASCELIERSLAAGSLGPTQSLIGCTLAACEAGGGKLPDGLRSSAGEPARQYLKRVLYAARPLRFNGRGIEHTAQRFRARGVDLTIADLPEDGQRFAGEEPVVTVIIRCDHSGFSAATGPPPLRRIIRALESAMAKPSWQ